MFFKTNDSQNCNVVAYIQQLEQKFSEEINKINHRMDRFEADINSRLQTLKPMPLSPNGMSTLQTVEMQKQLAKLNSPKPEEFDNYYFKKVTQEVKKQSQKSQGRKKSKD